MSKAKITGRSRAPTYAVDSAPSSKQNQLRALIFIGRDHRGPCHACREIRRG
jgi:hypothetical protein